MSCTATPSRQSKLASPAVARRSLWLGCCGAATILASSLYAPYVSTGPILCPFRLLTGLPCPGCGLTRSFCAMGRGDIRHALAFHALGPFLYAGVLVGTPLQLFQGLAGKPVAIAHQLLFSKQMGIALGYSFMIYQAIRLVVMGASGTLWADARGSLIGTLLSHIYGWLS